MANLPSEQDFSKMMSQIAAKAWTDANFKKRLLADPASVSAEFGMPLPPGLQLKVMEDTPQVRHFILPPRPPLAELSDEQLDQVAGGTNLYELAVNKIVYTPPSTPSTCSSCSCW